MLTYPHHNEENNMTRNAKLALQQVRARYNARNPQGCGQSYQDLMCELQGTQTHRLDGSGLKLRQLIRMVVGGWL